MKKRRHALALLSRVSRYVGVVELRGMLRFDAHEYDKTPDDFVFEPPDEEGLWVCVGRYVWRPDVHFESQIDEGEYVLVDDKYRRPTAREWARLASGRPLWRSKWTAPVPWPRATGKPEPMKMGLRG